MADAVELEARGDRLVLRLRVKPGGRADRLIGAHGGALKLEVRAAPERGKANHAIVKLLARELGLARSQVELISGGASQDKQVALQGSSPGAIASSLAALGIPSTVKEPCR